MFPGLCRRFVEELRSRECGSRDTAAMPAMVRGSMVLAVISVKVEQAPRHCHRFMFATASPLVEAQFLNNFVGEKPPKKLDFLSHKNQAF